MGGEIAKDAGIKESKFREIWDASENDRTLGKRSLESVLEEILRENQCYSDALLQELVGKRKESKYESFAHMHKDILPMLQALKEKDIKIGLITNCFSEEREAIKNSILFPYFDVVCMSCEIGLKKPVQALWYLKEGAGQPVGRLPEFMGASNPMNLVDMVER